METNTCPMCGVDDIKETIEEETVELGHPEYGGIIGNEVVQVPVSRCVVCKFQWTDYRAEEIRDAAHARITKANPEKMEAVRKAFQ